MLLQCYYNAQAGIKKLTTETGAGQWGTALSFACTLFGMEAEVWQVGSSYDQKPYRRLMMELYGSKVVLFVHNAFLQHKSYLSIH
jgi:tryptophan synthase beta chain